MKREIERKYLVRSDDYRRMAVSQHRIRQGYLDFCPDLTVRVRIKDNQAFLTLKTASRDGGLSRDEWEKEISLAEAEALLERMAKGRVVEKIRYIVPWNGRLIEVDEFISPRPGLVLAEIEWESDEEARGNHDLPSWMGEEVTGDRRYYNSFMARYG